MILRGPNRASGTCQPDFGSECSEWKARFRSPAAMSAFQGLLVRTGISE